MVFGGRCGFMVLTEVNCFGGLDGFGRFGAREGRKVSA